MVALPAVLVSVNEIRLPKPLLAIAAPLAELESWNVIEVLLRMVEVAAVLVLLKKIKPLLIRLALPTELALLKFIMLLLMILAFAAVLELEKLNVPLLRKFGAFAELLTMPAPSISNATPGLIVYE